MKFKQIINEEFQMKDVKNELKRFKIPFKVDDLGIVSFNMKKEKAKIPGKNQQFLFDGNVIHNLGICIYKRQAMGIICKTSSEFHVLYMNKGNEYLVKIEEYY